MTASLLLTLLGAEQGATPLVPPWRSERRCGQNALVAFLELHSVPFMLADVDTLLPDHPQGSSIEEIRLAADALGLPSRVLHVSPAIPSDWSKHLPAIVHLDSQFGHFVVLLRVGEDLAEYVDLSAIQVQRMPAQAFLNAMSGNIVVCEGVWRCALPYVVGGAALALAIVLATGSGKSWRFGL